MYDVMLLHMFLYMGLIVGWISDYLVSVDLIPLILLYAFVSLLSKCYMLFSLANVWMFYFIVRIYFIETCICFLISFNCTLCGYAAVLFITNQNSKSFPLFFTSLTAWMLGGSFVLSVSEIGCVFNVSRDFRNYFLNAK